MLSGLHPGRTRRTARLGLWALAAALAATAPVRAAVDFEKEIAPILIKRCSECHGADKQKAELRLDSRSESLKAGESGMPALVPGNADASEIVKRVTHADPDEVMPP